LDELKRKLIDAWRKWDQRPGSPNEADHMEDACQALAEKLGIPTLEFRELLIHAKREGWQVDRRIGYSYKTVLEKTIENL
jgi:hypothetical protein